MILIYENFFFKKGVKPKNNKELFCYLIVQYIKNKIKKIKLNALVNLIIYKECLSIKNDKNNIFNRTNNENVEARYDFEESKRHRKANISERNRKTKKDEEE